MKDKKPQSKPRKDPSKMLVRVAQVKFSEDSYEKVMLVAEEQGFSSMSAFLRTLALRAVKVS